MRNTATLRGSAAIALAVVALGWGRGFRQPSRDPVLGSERPPSAEAALDSGRDAVETAPSIRLLDSAVDAWLVDGRDPFFPEPPGRLEPTPDPLPQVHQFQLAAVWVQPGRRLAVINGQVVRPGDRIGGCTLERCEPNAVWLANEFAARRLPLQRKPSSSPRLPSP